MEIEYELTPEDLTAFRQHTLQRRPSARIKWSRFAIVFLGLVIVAGFHLSTAGPSEKPFLYGFVIGVVIGFVFGVFAVMVYGGAAAAKAQRTQPETAFKGRRRLILGPEGVTQTYVSGRSTNFWASIDAIEATANHIFLYLDARTAYLVPRRAFSCDEAFAKFVKTAQDYLEAAKSAPATAGPLWQRPLPTAIQSPGFLQASDPAGGITADSPDEKNPRS